MQRKIVLRSGVGLAALALAATACGSTTSASSGTSHPASSHSSMSSMAPSGSSAGAATTTAAAQLYAGLDQLLVEHVDLTANVVQTAISAGPSSAQTKAALAALDQNTQGLGKAIGSVYGASAQREFLKLWRAHIGYFVNYTLGVASKDHAKVATAQKDLAGYTSQFSAFIAGATKLPKSAVAADLQGHVSTLETAINAIIAKSPGAGAALLAAENHMAGTGAVLAQGIAASQPSKFAAARKG